uniref:Uncharacterized protein n=1 Tax=Arundo donax TaxID=35708 RepID=A0A0A9BCQ5_ARUDO
MEEDVGDLDPTHPALLHAQQPFSQILSSAFLPDQGAVFPGGACDKGSVNNQDALRVRNKDLLPGDKEYSKDMFTIAFFKGIEEAAKFLPARHRRQVG